MDVGRPVLGAASPAFGTLGTIDESCSTWRSDQKSTLTPSLGLPSFDIYNSKKKEEEKKSQEKDLKRTYMSGKRRDKAQKERERKRETCKGQTGIEKRG